MTTNTSNSPQVGCGDLNKDQEFKAILGYIVFGQSASQPAWAIHLFVKG